MGLLGFGSREIVPVIFAVFPFTPDQNGRDEGAEKKIAEFQAQHKKAYHIEAPKMVQKDDDFIVVMKAIEKKHFEEELREEVKVHVLRQAINIELSNQTLIPGGGGLVQ